MKKAQQDARQHIETIRRELLGGLTPDPTSRLFNVLTGALEIISKKVHYKDCHFLNELIQNFDDTAYNKVDEPTIKLKLTDTHFSAWSNEDGFKPEDVDSLCAIGRSSKASDLESTGENGIGFKSIFKVADQATILSYPYSFTFDTTSELEDLGMIVPSWVNPPTETKYGTLLTFRLKKCERTRSALSDQLKNFDFYSLLFSRVLRKIKIDHQIPGSFATTEAALRGDPEAKTELVIKKDNVIHTIESFVMRNYNAKTAIKVNIRKSPTTIKLAFPFVRENDVGQHRTCQQSYRTYAFQAIQDFGFSFMVHAEFILDASRSHVEPDQEWNIELGKCVQESIVKAMTWLAKDGDSPIPLSWPLYLDSLERIQDRYFRAIASSVKETLRSKSLVRMDCGAVAGVDTPRFYCPTEATIVDSEFRHENRPLLDHSSELSSFLSDKYSQPAQDCLTLLGVTRMDYSFFTQRFAVMVAQHPKHFRRKPEWWHSAVAKILLRHPSCRGLWQELWSSAIVPLHDGTWTKPERQDVFLPSETGPPIPSGFSIRTVASVANRDISRRRMLEELGLRTCDPSDVHTAILNGQGSQDWSSEQLLEQAVYLFLTGYEPKGTSFNFVDSRGTTTSNELLFLSDSRAASLRLLFDADLQISWLHDQYHSPPAIESDEWVEWREWLHQWENILDDVPVIHANGQLSTAFEDLYRRCGFEAALNFLRQSLRLPLEDLRWCKNVGELVVATTHGPRKLRETALPALHKDAHGMVPLISIGHIELDWAFLWHFGVCVSVDKKFLFYQLSFLKANKHAEDLHDSAQKIYAGLGDLTKDKPEIVRMRNDFQAEKLILAPDGEWYNAHKVRWDSKFDCTQYPILRGKYEACRRFFREILQVRPTNLADLIAEIRYQSEQTFVTPEPKAVIRIMRNLLQSLDSMLEIGPSSSKISELRGLKMFPVATHQGQWTLESADSGEFWIPDISVLHACFWGHAPLLDLTGHANGTNISNIVSVLGLGSRLLTEAVQDHFDKGTDKGIPDDKLARDLSRKAEYIQGILKAEGQSACQVAVHVNRFRNLKVFRMREISVTRYVIGKSCRYECEKEEGFLHSTVNAEELVIFLGERMKPHNMARLLRKEMAKCLDVTKHSDLLGDLLAADDPKSLLEDLQRAGAYQMDMANVNDSHQVGASPEPDSDSDAAGVPSADTTLGKSASSTGSAVHADEKNPMARAATTTPPARSAPRISSGSSEMTRLGSVDDSNDEFLASAFAKVSVADNGPSSRISQGSPRFVGQPRQIEDANQATRTPRLMFNWEEQSSSSPRQSSSGTRRYRPALSFGRRRSPSGQAWGGSSSHLRQLLWDGSSLSQPGPSSTQNQEIGWKGEHILFRFLQQQLGPSFEEKHWTSNGRKSYIPNKCLNHRPRSCPPECPNYYYINEGSYADFTIEDPDASQAFTQYLRANWEWDRSVDGSTKYHLEVKSTPARVESDAYWTFTPNQTRMARNWSVNLATASEPLRDVYLLVRVFDIDGEPKLRFVVDPWASISLDVISPIGMKFACGLESNTKVIETGYAYERHVELHAAESAYERRASDSFLSTIRQNAEEGAADNTFNFTFEAPQPSHNT